VKGGTLENLVFKCFSLYTNTFKQLFIEKKTAEISSSSQLLFS
jgi:hypothetical protein